MYIKDQKYSLGKKEEEERHPMTEFRQQETAILYSYGQQYEINVSLTN